MAGYTRNDTSNNIATGNVINAADLDGEFDALVAAFHASTGHTHDGTAANGAPITKIGPVQDLVISTGAITPKTDNTVDLGSSSFEFKDLYIDGTANIDALVADTADINAGTIDGVVIGGSTTAAGSFTTLTTSSTVTLNGGTANGVLYLNGSKVATSGSALTFDGTNLGVGAAASALTTYRGAEFAGTTATTGGFLRMRTSDSSIISLDFTDSNGRAIFTTTNHPVRFGVNDSEQMRLTSTGLGIGTSSPFARLHVQKAGNIDQYLYGTGVSSTARLYFLNDSANCSIGSTSAGNELVFFTGVNERMRLDSSGNLGLGVTPSAWNTNSRALQVGGNGYVVLENFNGVNLLLTSNTYRNSGGSNIYLTSAAAASYVQASGAHQWFTAASGTAGNAITFTQAMTLTSGGNLLVGTTSDTGNRLKVVYTEPSFPLFDCVGGNGNGKGSIVVRARLNGFASTIYQAGYSDGTGLAAQTWESGMFDGLSDYRLSYNGTERARITSGGDLLVGTTSNPNNSKVVIAGSLTQNGAYINSSYNYTDISGTTYGLWRIQLLTGGGGRIDLSEYGTDVSTPNAAQYTITFYVTSGGTVNATSSRSYTNYANTVLLVKDSTYLYLAVSKGHPNGAGYWNVEFRGSNNSADLAFAHSSTISGYTTVYTV